MMAITTTGLKGKFTCNNGDVIEIKIDQKNGYVQIRGAKKVTSVCHVKSNSGKFSGKPPLYSNKGLAITIDYEQGQREDIRLVIKDNNPENLITCQEFPGLKITAERQMKSGFEDEFIAVVRGKKAGEDEGVYPIALGEVKNIR